MLCWCRGQCAHHAEGTDHKVIIKRSTQNREKVRISKQLRIIKWRFQIDRDHKSPPAHPGYVFALGAELGIYCAERFASSDNYRSAHNILDDQRPLFTKASRRMLNRFAPECAS